MIEKANLGITLAKKESVASIKQKKNRCQNFCNLQYWHLLYKSSKKQYLFQSQALKGIDSCLSFFLLFVIT